MVAVCNSETVGLSRKQVGRAAVYSVDREQDPAAEAPAAWRGRKPEEEKKAAKARARAKATHQLLVKCGWSSGSKSGSRGGRII